jgi:hypothetical protein
MRDRAKSPKFLNNCVLVKRSSLLWAICDAARAPCRLVVITAGARGGEDPGGGISGTVHAAISVPVRRTTAATLISHFIVSPERKVYPRSPEYLYPGRHVYKQTLNYL